MIRFLFRTIGYMTVAAGFVGLMIDGARSMAGSVLVFTSTADLAVRLFADRYALLRPWVEQNIHPLAWEPVLAGILRLPASVLGLALGFLLLWFGQPDRREVGYVTRR